MRISKRAFFGAGILGAIIGLVVIAILAGGPIQQGYKYAKANLFPERNSNDTFVPYEPVLSENEQRVDDSMKGLVEAINFLAEEGNPSKDVLEKNPSLIMPLQDTKYKIKKYSVEYNIFFYEQVHGWWFNHAKRYGWVGSDGPTQNNSLNTYFNVKKHKEDTDTIYQSPYAKIAKMPIAKGMKLQVWYEKWPEGAKNIDDNGYCSAYIESPVFDEDDATSGLKTYNGNKDSGENCIDNSASRIRKCPGIEAIHCGVAHNDEGGQWKSHWYGGGYFDCDYNEPNCVYFTRGKLDAQSNPEPGTVNTRNYAVTAVRISDEFKSRDNLVSGGDAGSGIRLVSDEERKNMLNIDGTKIGETEVKCNVGKCYVDNFELPQTIEKKSIFNPTSWIAGHGDPKYLAYFEAFPEGPQEFWHSSGWDIASVGLIVGFAAFDLVPVFGKAGKAVFIGIKEGAKEVGEKGLKTATRNAASALAKSGEIALESTKSFFRRLISFGSKRAFAHNFIKEIFEGGWYGIGQKISHACSDTIDGILGKSKLYKKLQEGALSDAELNTLRKEMQGSIVDVLEQKRSRLDPAFERAWKSSNPEKLLRPDGSNIPDAELKKIILKEYRQKIANEMTEQSLELYSTKLTKKAVRELQQRLAVKNFVKTLLKEGTEEFDEKLLRESIEGALKTLDSLSEKELKDAVEKGGQLIGNYIGEDGFLELAKFTGSETITTASKVKITNQFLDVITTSPQAESLVKKVASTGWTAAKGLKRGTVGPGANPIKWVTGLSPVKLAKPSLIMDVPTGGLAWVGRTGVKSVTGLYGWVRDHQYPILAAIAFYAALRDSVNEKFQPVGINELAVSLPFMLGEPKTYSLDESTKAYYVTNEKYREHRFYAVSPCKADLVVFRGLCTCQRFPMDQHYMFFEGEAPNDVKGIELNHGFILDDDLMEQYIIDNNMYVYSDDKKSDIPENIENFKDNLMSEYNKQLRGNYTFLKSPDELRSITDIKNIDSEENKEIIMEWNIERLRYNIVGFYQDVVNGPYIDRVLDGWEAVFGQGMAERGSTIPYKQWDFYRPFFNFENVQKSCNQRNFLGNYINILTTNSKSLFQDYDEMYGQISSNPYAKPEYVTPCIMVTYQRQEGYNDGYNYCIDEFSSLDNLRWVLTGVEVGISLVITGMTGGIAAPIAFATTGIVSGLIQEKLAQGAKWPAYQEQFMDPSVAKVDHDPT